MQGNVEQLTLSPRSPFSPCKGKKQQVRAGLSSFHDPLNGEEEHAGYSPLSAASGQGDVPPCTLPSTSSRT